MKKLLVILLLLLAGMVSSASAQEQVCISREAATSCLTAQDRAKALEAENAALKQAIADLKDEISTIKIELARTTGEKTQLEATLVRYNAIMDILIKSARPKKIGLINLF